MKISKIISLLVIFSFLLTTLCYPSTSLRSALIFEKGITTRKQTNVEKLISVGKALNLIRKILKQESEPYMKDKDLSKYAPIYIKNYEDETVITIKTLRKIKDITEEIYKHSERLPNVMLEASIVNFYNLILGLEGTREKSIKLMIGEELFKSSFSGVPLPYKDLQEITTLSRFPTKNIRKKLDDIETELGDRLNSHQITYTIKKLPRHTNL